MINTGLPSVEHDCSPNVSMLLFCGDDVVYPFYLPPENNSMLPHVLGQLVLFVVVLLINHLHIGV